MKASDGPGSSSVKIFLMDNWTCIVYGPGAVQYLFSVFSFLTVNSFSPLFLTVNKQVPLSKQLTNRFHYLNDESSDPEFLLRLPMTKAGVKALDTVENFLTSPTAPQEVVIYRI